MRVLLVTPPMVQVNAPYAAGPHLAGFLRSKGIDVVQTDLSLDLALRLFSRAGVQEIAHEINASSRSPSVRHFLRCAGMYEETVEAVIGFLQGRNTELAGRIVARTFLPEGPRFKVLKELAAAWDGADPLDVLFGSLGIQDRAKYLASLLIDDLADTVRDGIDGRFDLSRYADKLAVSAASFDPLASALEDSPTLVARAIDALTDEAIDRHDPSLVGLTVPFPGALYGALRIARQIKRTRPEVRVILGGGYVNTELRQLDEPRLFDYVDYVTLDAGEVPLLRIVEQAGGKAGPLCRTFVRTGAAVSLIRGDDAACVPHEEAAAPTYAGLDLGRYISLCEMPNPMHRLWSDGRWNKMLLAHGCYWHRCAFCDTSLDYIRRFDRASACKLVDRIEAVIRETGGSGFHFVDEAAPPALLKGLADQLLKRKTTITWWTNIRFEPGFTRSLAELLARSGCVAATGGLETVMPRLLKLMNKGITVDASIQAMKNLSDAGILVHAYLMYGFPSQTAQETVDALEVVRQLFEAGVVQSAFWHRFALTCHSPMSRDPAAFGIQLAERPRSAFAVNELAFEDAVSCDHAALGEGLRKATYNFMYGIGLDVMDVRAWFPVAVPRSKVARTYVRRLVAK